MKQLKAQVRKQGIPKYYNMLKPELIKPLAPKVPDIIEEPIPEINIPIMKPTQPIRNSRITSLKDLASKAATSVHKKINNFSDWILSYVPEPIQKTVNERVESLKEKVNKIFKFVPKENKKALDGYLKTYRINGQTGYDPKTFTYKIIPNVEALIRKKKLIKAKFILTFQYKKENPATGQIDETHGCHHSNVIIITGSSDIYNLILTEINYLLEQVEQYQNQGSSWQFDQIEYFDINIDPFEPLSEGSYIPLPQKIASKQAVINVKNEKDHECFKWAVTSAVSPKKKDPQRLNDEMRENSKHFNWSGIEFPISANHIDKFEKQNPYAINVLGYDGDKVYPHRISNKKATVITLLLISNGETSHYCWVKDTSRLLS